MPARRAADRSDVRSIKLETSGILLESPHRPLAILNVLGKGRRAGLGQGIVDRHAHVAVRGQGVPMFFFAGLAFVAARPPASVNNHDARILLPRFECWRQIEIGFSARSAAR